MQYFLWLWTCLTKHNDERQSRVWLSVTPGRGGRLSFAPRTSPVEVVQLPWKRDLSIYNSTRGLSTKGSSDCLHPEEHVRSEKYLAWVFGFFHIFFLSLKKNQSFLLGKQPELKHTWGLKSSWMSGIFVIAPGTLVQISSQEGNGLRERAQLEPFGWSLCDVCMGELPICVYSQKAVYTSAMWKSTSRARGCC